MTKYRKKPVVIEAKQVLPRRVKQSAEWCGGTVLLDGHKYIGVIISTLKGKMTADIGDWIIKGVQGEFYPCKSDRFEQTYEPITDARLIEVVPDLLEFIKQWEGHHLNCDYLDEGSPRTDCTCGYEKERDKVLAKATDN